MNIIQHLTTFALSKCIYSGCCTYFSFRANFHMHFDALFSQDHGAQLRLKGCCKHLHSSALAHMHYANGDTEADVWKWEIGLERERERQGKCEQEMQGCVLRWQRGKWIRSSKKVPATPYTPKDFFEFFIIFKLILKFFIIFFKQS